MEEIMTEELKPIEQTKMPDKFLFVTVGDDGKFDVKMEGIPLVVFLGILDYLEINAKADVMAFREAQQNQLRVVQSVPKEVARK
jgi:hypothetical protein